MQMFIANLKVECCTPELHMMFNLFLLHTKLIIQEKKHAKVGECKLPPQAPVWTGQM